MRDYLASSYDRCAQTYDRTFRELQYEKFRTLVDPYMEFFEGKTIADLGCGTGLLSDFFEEHKIHANVVGMDISANMLKAAVLKGRTMLVHGDMYMLPIKRACIDVVCSFTVINIFPDNEDIIISEIIRVLKPGGLAIISMLEKVFNNGIIAKAEEYGFVYDCMKYAGQDIGLVLKKRSF